ncbi:serine/threonine protein kinase [Rhodococcus sp. ACPA4]|uniref:non-specific serine/threonine protein kinase n=1 Tax=Rhodococcus globerulus TaxID=33008 RepID=A0ABU4BRW8_RHOGO|nr:MULTISPECIES: serine/threonine-protein kinase [Rhodococcus]NRI69444.1 serine/threonine protein kinase [Rhodococcus sp. MS16]MCE4263277.1 serine/threonine protein kinase [Rhodococcus globerulus]MDV6266967.1 serine/threonine-protein kinase [Rhodococcus globerulus]PBC44400.1 serine/threonine protein kinase [Rhodococcus sp. ACPA4]QXW04109.1 serine/threonine protein kinase [Rhodococcus globerulus]
MTSREQTGRGIGPEYLLAGRYRLRSKIGGGGMGAVWLARDTLLSRDVAVKQVTTTAGLDNESAEEIRARTLREGRNAAKLSHPHSIGMYDVALEAGEPWLVMEYFPSRSLAQAMNLADTLPPLEVAQIGAQIAAALAESHAAGIVHRDIKPGNILIADRGDSLGIVKISDFGIARAKGDGSDRQDEVITGTPAYFAPEVARGDDPTEASDVFSLGSTLFTVIEGQPPFGIDSDAIALLHRVAKAEIYRPTKSGPLTDVLLQLLEPDPTRRPTMAQARDALAAVATGGGSVDQLIDIPVFSSDGAVPAWAHRTTQLPDPHRRNRLVGPTVTGLPAVQQNTPLGSVPSPLDLFSWPPRIPTGPADASTRDKVVAWAPLAMTAMVAIIIAAILIVLVLVFTV